MEGSELLAYGFQRRQDAQPLPRVAILGAWGLSLNKRFGGATPRQNRKYVHICIACWFLGPHIIVFVHSLFHKFLLTKSDFRLIIKTEIGF